MTATSDQMSFGLDLIRAIIETVQELKSAPVGPLYMAFMGSMDLDTFNRLLDFVLKTKLVRRDGDLLVWVG